MVAARAVVAGMLLPTFAAVSHIALVNEGVHQNATCLLHKKSYIGRTMTLMQLTAERETWRAKHTALMGHAITAQGILDGFIKSQAESEKFCSARLMEAKRAYDGLLKDVQRLSAQIESHQKVLEAEEGVLSATQISMKQVEDEYDAEKKVCAKEKAEAKVDLDRVNAELAELKAIANPKVRYNASNAGLITVTNNANIPTGILTTEANAVGLLQTGSSTKIDNYDDAALLATGEWTRDRCLAFIQFIADRGASDADPAACDKERKELQDAFTAAYIGVESLKKDAQERVQDKSCREGAAAEREAKMTPLTAQQVESTEKIEASSRALGELSPVLDLAKKRAEKMQEHIDETLTPECYEGGEVSKHLETVRNLIMALGECPGRNNFSLKIPTKKEEEKGEKALAAKAKEAAARAPPPPPAAEAAATPPAPNVTAPAGSFVEMAPVKAAKISPVPPPGSFVETLARISTKVPPKSDEQLSKALEDPSVRRILSMSPMFKSLFDMKAA